MSWNKDELKKIYQVKFPDRKLIMVSNRAPYAYSHQDGTVRLTMPASGVALSLNSVMQAIGGTWIASSCDESDQMDIFCHDALELQHKRYLYTIRRIYLNSDEEQGYYYGFANQGLWPSCFASSVSPQFIQSDWNYYLKVNRKFASVILDEASDKGNIIFIQDYHLALLPQLVKKAAPHLTVCQFWHIPWPSYEVFRTCPWRREILAGLLGNDLLGFHLHGYCQNFLHAVEKTLGARVDHEKLTITYLGKVTRVAAFPLSIDFQRFASLANSYHIKNRVTELRDNLSLQGIRVGLGVDRIDYTKGIPERLEALNIFFQKYPQYLERFSLLQLGPSSRIHIPEYKNLSNVIDSLVETINQKYGTERWKPIIFFKSCFFQDELVAFYQLADVMVISSLHDGMNLVAKEYIASRNEEAGALLLSTFAGAAHELTWAYKINPYNPEEIADIIHIALNDPPAEKLSRMLAMRSWIKEHDIYYWAAKFFDSL
jgi:trehalose 6-phosphate synthase